ncbi:MAG: V-type ATP synthase subunit B, partial [Candidatus Odinarchaeia archaeon]
MTYNLSSVSYQTVTEVSGPLLVIEKVKDVGYSELVKIITPDGETRLGTVLETSKDKVIVQVFE